MSYLQICLYCHDNEHSRYTDNDGRKASGESSQTVATGNPFADLKAMMGNKKA